MSDCRLRRLTSHLIKRSSGCFPGVFFFLLIAWNGVRAQDYTFPWGISVYAGASSGYSKGDTLTRQGLLFPTFGLSVSYEFGLGGVFYLRPSLGYMNRGAVTRVDAGIDPVRNLSLGHYKYTSRDHFVSNDLLFHIRPDKVDVFGGNPFLNLGVRNDFYLFSNFKAASDSPYYKPENTSMIWMRSNQFRSYVAGVVAAVGWRGYDLELGIEYYNQVYGSYAIPVEDRANYSQLLSRSFQLTATYRF